MKELNKEEKLTILLTFVIAVLMLILGFLTKTMRSTFEYQSIIPETNETVEEFNVIENIELEVKEEINQDVANYLEGEELLLKQVKLDFSQIDNQKLGTYAVTGKFKSQVLEIPVKIVDTKAPVVIAEKNYFTWYLEPNETIEDVKKYVKVTVKDNYDTDLKAGDWIKELPKKSGKVTYPIQVKDSSGNETKFEVVIDYEMQTTDNNVPVNNEPDVPEVEKPDVPENNEPEVPDTPQPEEPDTPEDENEEETPEV